MTKTELVCKGLKGNKSTATQLETMIGWMFNATVGYLPGHSVEVNGDFNKKIKNFNPFARPLNRFGFASNFTQAVF